MSDSQENKAWTSAYLVAISLQATFPQAKNIEVDLLGNYLAIRCDLPFALQRDFFVLVEEKIRYFSKSSIPIVQKEMVPISAAGYFKSKGIYEAFKDAMDTPTIEFFEYGHFTMLCDKPLADSFEGLSHIKLVDLVSEPDDSYTLIGAVGVDKQELKECVKKYQKAKERNHLTLGERFKFFVVDDDEGLYWLPKGLLFRDQIYKSIQKIYEEYQFVQVEVPHHSLIKKSHQDLFDQIDHLDKVFSLQTKISSETFCLENGLFDYPYGIEGLSSIFCSVKEIEKECISSLHFAQKISTILQFCGSYVLFCSTKIKTSPWEIALRQSGLPYEKRRLDRGISRLEFQVKDHLGRIWPMFSMELEIISESLCHIVCCHFPSLERIAAWMLENEHITG